jgi:hypothetical protein
MGQPRADELPHPATVDQLYLAAILEELRALRADLSARAPGPLSFEGPTLEGVAPVLEALGLPTEAEAIVEHVSEAVEAEKAAMAETPAAEPVSAAAPEKRTPSPLRTGKPARKPRARQTRKKA